MGSGRRSATVVLAVSIAATALSVAAVGVRIATPSSGTAILTAGEAFASNGVAVAVIVGASTPLRDGDVVTAMAGRSTASWADDLIDRQEQPLAVAAGETLRFDVERSGQRLAIDVSLVPYPIVAVLASAWGTLAFVMTLLAVAVFAFWRRPEVPATGALLIAAVGGAGSTIPFLLGQDPLDLATGLFTLSLAPMAFVYLLLWAGLMDFALVFPRPVDAIARRPVLRSIPYLVVFGVYLASLVLAALRAPDALAWLGAWGPLTLLPTIVAFATLPVILIRRWRHGPLEDRRLLRAYAYVVAFIVLADLVIWIIPEALGGRSLLPWTIQGLTGLPFVLVIAASILRYRAFDIDVVVRRSLVYGGLTVVVVATYSLAAGLLGALLGGSSPFATSLLATGVAAIVALPVRDGLQGAATRLLYGDRDEPVRAIRRLGERLEWSVDPDTMPRVVVDAVADALRLPYVGLELGDGPSARLAAERGVAPAELLARPITFRSRTIGRLLVGARGPADPLSAADVSLLEDLTRQVGVAAHAALLTEDLRASRERIIKTREEERRRLRRDLHDGLGPALAAIGMRAEAAASLVDSKPVEAERLLAELRGEVAVAVSDIRRLVDGLRPPAIDELGLVGAVRAAADRLRGDGAPAVSVESEGALSDLPAAVEVAAYRIATEAMTNAVRHAGAGQCSVRLVGDADLTVIVDDDGRGLPAEPPDGVGLASMHERAAELGGECKVERRPTGGTRVIARLPLARSGIGP